VGSSAERLSEWAWCFHGMTLMKIKVFGGDNVGLYIKATNKFFLYHSNLSKNKVEVAENILKAQGIPVKLVSSLILSPFIVCNSNGVVIPRLWEDYAIEDLVSSLRRLGINYSVVDFKFNTFGNLVLANDAGAIASPLIAPSIRKIIADTLDVEVASTTIGRFSYIGSLGVANNKGGVFSSVIKEDESRLIRDVLNISVYNGSINGGVEFISSGLVANDYGALVGTSTTGRELMVITQALEVD